MCLACDANYAVNGTVTTAADGTVQVKVQQKSCDNLQVNCYEYLDTMETASGEAKSAMKAKKSRKKKVDIEKLNADLEACLDDATCADSDKAAKMQALSTKIAETETESK